MGTANILRDLVIANRILAHEGVVDAYGHISVRHPERADRFFLSASRSPELVTLDDIIEYDLDCNPVDLRGRAQYTERPIHGAIYRKRSDVMSVVHNHAYEVIPFTVAQDVKLRALLMSRRGSEPRFPSGIFETGLAIPIFW
jgi:ribulose-5-phosphate 4-epimerase/fuculose-1-phosphate aldolase